MEVPRTHAIGLLLNLCKEAGYSGTDGHIDSVSLTQYAVTARYPGEEEPVSRDDAREAAELAAKTFEWVENQIKNQTSTGTSWNSSPKESFANFASL